MNPRALIVDDEPLAQQRVEDLLNEAGRIEVIGRCGDGLKAVDQILALRPDLVLLDIQMPGLDGFGVLEAVAPEFLPMVLFVTAYDRYAIRAFEAQALDYLLKPFDAIRLRKALNRVLDWHERAGARELQEQIKSLLKDVASRTSCPDRFLARSGERRVLVRANEIQWIEAEDNYIRLHTSEGSPLMRQTLEGILGRLDPLRFRRIHRSHIVNLDFVKELQPWFSGDTLVFMRDGTRLTVSRTFRSNVSELGSDFKPGAR